MHDIKLLVILSVLKSVASLFSIKKRDNLQNNFTNKFVDLGVVYIYIYIKKNVLDIKMLFPNRKTINSIIQISVQSSLEY